MVEKVAVTVGAVNGLVFGFVYLFWGWPSVVGSLRWSVGKAHRYVLEWGPSAIISSDTWIQHLVQAHLRLFPLLGCAVVGITVTTNSLRRNRRWTPIHLTTSLLLVMSIPLVVRPFTTYWVYPLPWISVFGVIGGYSVYQKAGMT